MNPEKDKEFDQNMNQLVRLLKKILKNLPSQGSLPQFSPSDKDSNVHLNLFFTFFPMAPEEFEEFEDLYDPGSFHEDKGAEDLSSELSPSDLEFLRVHGIRF